MPPEQAKTALLNSPTRSTSCVRPERIGPTLGASVLWKMVANLVGPAPHASKTMSAESRPDCGRAPGSLETLTTTAGCAAIAGSVIGLPVKGITGVGAMVVLVDDDDEEVDDDDDVDVALDDEVVDPGSVTGVGGNAATAVLAGAAEPLLQATSA